MFDMWIWILLAALAVLGMGIFFLRRKGDGEPGGLLETPTFISQMLTQGMDQRCRFDVSLGTGDDRARVLRGPCVAVEQTAFTIDANLGYNMPSWTGQQVQVFFTMHRGRTSSSYDCTTEISGIVPYRGGYAIRLRIPAKLANNQRRAFVRLAPSRGLVADMGLWMDCAALKSGNTAPMDLTEPTFPFENLRLDNVSAGGARVTVEFSERRHAIQAQVSKGHALLLHLRLRDVPDGRTLTLWLKCVVTLVQPETGGVGIGLRFTSWAATTDPQAEFAWFSGEKEGGVAPLAAWVMRRHLEIYKNLSSE